MQRIKESVSLPQGKKMNCCGAASNRDVNAAECSAGGGLQVAFSRWVLVVWCRVGRVRLELEQPARVYCERCWVPRRSASSEMVSAHGLWHSAEVKGIRLRAVRQKNELLIGR